MIRNLGLNNQGGATIAPETPPRKGRELGTFSQGWEVEATPKSKMGKKKARLTLSGGGKEELGGGGFQGKGQKL